MSKNCLACKKSIILELFFANALDDFLLVVLFFRDVDLFLLLDVLLVVLLDDLLLLVLPLPDICDKVCVFTAVYFRTY